MKTKQYIAPQVEIYALRHTTAICVVSFETQPNNGDYNGNSWTEAF